MEQNKKVIHKAREAYLALGAFKEMAEIFETVTVKNEMKDGTEFEVNVINTINKIMSDYISCIKPYKLDDLEKGKAVFDDILDVQAIIFDIDYESKKIKSAYWLDKNDCLVTYDVDFEEGRFYPIQYYALLMQED